ncbi:hypothetical protein P154DRAFT_427505, partial [Amniculicola lignicola CBS 123094]
LVPGSTPGPYIALSYVWGSVQSFNTKMENLDSVRAPGSFSEGNNEEAFIPKSIRDAMRICIRLDIRYLWVDTLCVVQDDAASKHEEIKRMGGIYAGAYITLAASGGFNVDSGIWGIHIEKEGQGKNFRSRFQSPIANV